MPPKLSDETKARKRTITNGSNEVDQNEHFTSRTPDSELRPKSANLSPSLDFQRVTSMLVTDVADEMCW